MAAERNARRNQNAPRIRANGAAAYQYGTAVPKPRPEQRPQPKRRPAPKKRVKAKIVISPFSVVGMLAVSLMMLLVIGGYARLYEATDEVGDLNNKISQLQAENEHLQSIYDEKVDIDAIEQAAGELGMHMPNSRQTIYLDLNGHDSAQIMRTQSENIFVRIYQAISNAVKNLIEYFQ